MAKAVAALLAISALIAPSLASRELPSVLEEVTPGSGGSLSAGVSEGNALLLEFRRFKEQYGKVYATEDEERTRLEVFKSNWRLVTNGNAATGPFTLELNEFADLTWDEFKQHRLAEMQNCSAQTASPRSNGLQHPPAARDWREEGIVSPVKNQGHCGSCWTFSTTGAIEAAMMQKYGKPANLSEQQLVDCAGAFKNMGCGGGLPSQAFEYVMYNGGLDTEDAYPYTATDGECHFSTKGVGAKVVGVVNITQYDEAELRGAVGLVKPVSIAFEVVNDFRFYKTGVYESDVCGSSPDTVNHAVLAVGYDAFADPPYWIIKNSWGADWGDQGYFKMKMGSNMCGVATCCSYPVV